MSLTNLELVNEKSDDETSDQDANGDETEFPDGHVGHSSPETLANDVWLRDQGIIFRIVIVLLGLGEIVVVFASRCRLILRFGLGLDQTGCHVVNAGSTW